MLESGVLANKKFAEFASDQFVALVGAPRGTHGMFKAPGPNKGEEIDVCIKYPAVGSCDVHNHLNSNLRFQLNLQDVKTTPFTIVLNPNDSEEAAASKSGPVTGSGDGVRKDPASVPKASGSTKPTVREIFRIEGEWTTMQMQRRIDEIEKAMPGPKVRATDFAKYEKALQLATDGKASEAKRLLLSLSRKKIPERFKQTIEQKLQSLQEEPEGG